MNDKEQIAAILAEHKAEAHKRDGEWWRGYEAALHWISKELEKAK